MPLVCECMICLVMRIDDSCQSEDLPVKVLQFYLQVSTLSHTGSSDRLHLMESDCCQSDVFPVHMGGGMYSRWSLTSVNQMSFLYIWVEVCTVGGV